MGSIYPVGSLYFCTQSTCPMASLISGSTWEKVGSSIITSVNTNVPVKGNGTALGLTDGTQNWALENYGDYAAIKGCMCSSTTSYGKAVGTQNDLTSLTKTKLAIGITTDSSKSGIVGTVTRSSLTVNIFKRTA